MFKMSFAHTPKLVKTKKAVIDMVKILVVGSEGFVASAIIPVLQKAGHEVIGLDNFLYGQRDHKIRLYEVDLRDKEKLAKCLAIIQPEVIVHTAAVVGDPASCVNLRKTIDVNCVGTRNLCKIAKDTDTRFVHLSTASVYGAEYNVVLDEDTVVMPQDFYGMTKLQQEKIVIDHIPYSNALIFRLGTAWGGCFNGALRFDLIANKFCGQAVTDGELSVFGGGQQRPFVNIQDVARAVLYGIDKSLSGLFNLACDNITITQLAENVAQLAKCKIVVNKEITDPRNYVVNCDKLKSTGFDFQYSIFSGNGAVEMLKILQSTEAKNWKSKQYHRDAILRLLQEEGKW